MRISIPQSRTSKMKLALILFMLSCISAQTLISIRTTTTTNTTTIPTTTTTTATTVIVPSESQVNIQVGEATIYATHGSTVIIEPPSQTVLWVTLGVTSLLGVTGIVVSIAIYVLNRNNNH